MMADDEDVASKVHGVNELNIAPSRSRQLYDGWSQSYDQEVGCGNVTKYKSPAAVAAEVARLLADRKDARILDVAAGTGLAAEEMVKYGFHNIDGVDASPGMLEVARSKKIYTHLIEAYISPKQMPITNDTYDVAVGAGCFGPGHLQSDVYEELIRVIKPGGFFVHILRDYFIGKFEPAIERLQKEGKWRVVERHPADTEYINGPGILLTLQIL